jgi:hypothetical protein
LRNRKLWGSGGESGDEVVFPCADAAFGAVGSDDTQFFNKSSFRNSRLFGCGVADVAILLEDTDDGVADTKVGGGIRFENFHAQFDGPSATRLGSSPPLGRRRS